MKQSFKKKISTMKEERRATGGGPLQSSLTDEDLKLMSIIGVEHVSGLPDAVESYVANIEVIDH